jgi:hypothetical protein
MKQLSTILRQVIFEIFGDMFFMFPEQYDPDETVTFPPDWIKFRINISQGVSYFLNCYFTPQQARQMAENFLGEDAGGISDEIVDETLKEAVNVIGGNLLNRLGTDYELGIPEKQPTEDLVVLENLHNDPDIVSILLNVENNPFLAIVTPS